MQLMLIGKISMTTVNDESLAGNMEQPFKINNFMIG